MIHYLIHGIIKAHDARNVTARMSQISESTFKDLAIKNIFILIT